LRHNPLTLLTGHVGLKANLELHLES
jgi:hypothetical protein